MKMCDYFLDTKCWSLLKLLQQMVSFSSPMAIGLYSVSLIRAGSHILTSTDVLSPSIWKSMALHARGGNSNKVRLPGFITAFLKCKRSEFGK